MFKRYKIRSYEMGLRFRDDEIEALIGPGIHWLFDPLNRVRVEVVSRRAPWLVHAKLDLIVKSCLLAEQATVIDLKDYERALVWVDGRFSHVLTPGLYAYWNGARDVRVVVIDARNVRFEHEDLAVIARWAQANRLLDVVTVARDHAGVLFIDGKYVETLTAGTYAFWRDVADAKVVTVDTRELLLDVSGQEIMTADLEGAVRRRAEELGLAVASVGVRDVILPGEMKDLMNKVTEAKKAAEANLIARREETAAMRSQANTAKVLAENPTLMRLRELEVLEKIAANGNLKVMLGEKGLLDRVVNLM